MHEICGAKEQNRFTRLAALFSYPTHGTLQAYRGQKCAENYTKWHDKIISESRIRHVGKVSEFRLIKLLLIIFR